MTPSELEKRLKIRYPSTIYVSVYTGNNYEFFGLLADLSGSGFKLCSDSEIISAQDYALAIRDPFSERGGEYIPFSVRAIWCHKSNDGLYEAGFQFPDSANGGTGSAGESFFKQLRDDFKATARAINQLEKDSELN